MAAKKRSTRKRNSSKTRSVRTNLTDFDKDLGRATVALQGAIGILNILEERLWENSDENVAVSVVADLVRQADDALSGQRSTSTEVRHD